MHIKQWLRLSPSKVLVAILTAFLQIARLWTSPHLSLVLPKEDSLSRCSAVTRRSTVANPLAMEHSSIITEASLCKAIIWLCPVSPSAEIRICNGNNHAFLASLLKVMSLATSFRIPVVVNLCHMEVPSFVQLPRSSQFHYKLLLAAVQICL